MNIRLAALAATITLVGGLAGCATDEHYYGPAGAPYADVDYDAYYDGAYGPFVGGYWGEGDQFYYWSADHQHYHRDVGGHFARQGGRPGFNAVHGHAPAGGGGRGGGGGRR